MKIVWPSFRVWIFPGAAEEGPAARRIGLIGGPEEFLKPDPVSALIPTKSEKHF
jgi:hypothetical protein